MALATQCPHCQTIFRVAHDQLKLRAGLVRCGACKEIFNGIEHLLRPEDVPVVPVAAPDVPMLPPSETVWPELPSAPWSGTDAGAQETDPADYFPAVVFDPPDLAAALGPAIPLSEPATAEPLARMTLMQYSDDTDHVIATDPAIAETQPASTDRLLRDVEVDAAAGDRTIAVWSSNSGALVHRSAHETADELDQAIDYLQRKPWRGGKKSLSRKDVEGPRGTDKKDDGALPADEPGFVARSRRSRRHRAAVRKLLLCLGGLLLLIAAGQSVYVLRDQLAARLPASRPALESACQLFGCRIALPTQIDAVSIESNELVAMASSTNNFVLNLLLRNRSSVPQRWPAIELTLLDGGDKALVRRVFKPSEYLPATLNTAQGFAQNSEQSIKITFELMQQKAANYRVYLFYP